MINGRRYYTDQDVKLVRGIRHLLHTQRMTIAGAQRVLALQGPVHVRALASGDEPVSETERLVALIRRVPVLAIDPGQVQETARPHLLSYQSAMRKWLAEASSTAR